MKTVPTVLRGIVMSSFLVASMGVSSAYAMQAQDKRMIQSNYDQAIERCDALDGSDKDVCKQEAKAQREGAKADAKQAKKEAEAREEATADKREADYKLAKEKCEALSGDAEDACLADARAQYAQ